MQQENFWVGPSSVNIYITLIVYMVTKNKKKGGAVIEYSYEMPKVIILKY